MQNRPNERILVISHEHPDFSKGGAEIAAYNLFKSYRSSSLVEEAWFVARADRGNGVTGHLRMRRENEYLWEQGIADWSMRASHRDSLLGAFTDLIRQIKPTVVHAHHYVHLGVELFRVIKTIDPSIKVFLTLHEYIAICANHGQMVKTNGSLCYGASDEDCRRCFPDRTVEDFWLRRHFLSENLKFVDHFISPSSFLKQRYVAWGLSDEKISVIENGQDPVKPLPPRSLENGELRTVFGYFGQINKFKGLPVVLGALSRLDDISKKNMILEIHGANLDKQPAEFQSHVRSLLDPLIDEGIVKWVGPYEPHEKRKRLSHVDWVLVPSVWWENSPMVIQEAFQHGRPPIVSDIGGMAEKVEHNVDGLKVSAGSETSWAALFKRVIREPNLWQELYDGITPRPDHDLCSKIHLDLFANTKGVA